MVTLALVAIAAFIAGVLVGRANPKKADKVAEVASNIKDKVAGIVDKKN